MNIDTQIVLALNSLVGQSPLLDGLIVFFATYLAYILIVVLIGLVACSAYSRREKVELLLVTLGSGIAARFGVTELIRYLYHHPRPFVVLPIHPLVAETSWSFPSGHAMFFFALAMSIYLYNKRWGTGFFIGAALMAVARVAAGVHYPSDVIAGALMGTLIAYCVYAIFHRVIAKNSDQTY